MLKEANASRLIEARVLQWLCQLRRQILLDAVAVVASRATAALVCFLWMDQAFFLPRPARWAAWFSGLAALSWVVYGRLWRALRAADALAAVEGAQRHYPVLSRYLKSAWELGERVGAGHTSPQLALAHREKTERLLRGLPEELVFRWRPSTGALAGALAAALGLMTLPWVGGQTWSRVLAPWRDAMLESFVSIAPGDARLEWGEPARIEARWGDLMSGPSEVNRLELWISSRSGRRRASWTSAQARSAQFQVASLSEPLRYSLSWRGLKSRDYSLVPVPRPQLDSPRVRVAGRPAQALNAAEALQARRGDWIVVLGKPNAPLAKALLKVSFLPVPAVFKPAPDDAVEAGFLASEDGTFQIELETADGRRDPSPVVYALKAKSNEPPRVDLLSPAAPLQAAVDETVAVAYSARDDAGLRRLALVMRVDERQREIPLQDFGRSVPDFLGDYSWDLSGLPPGAKIEFRLKAVDDDRFPLSGFSQTGRIEIVDFEAGHESVRKRWRAAVENLGELERREERLAGALEGRDEATTGRELAGLPEAWKKAAVQARELAAAMVQDPYSNPGLAEQAQAAAEELERSAAAEVPSFAQAHRRRAETARRMRRLLEEGRGLQELQDFHGQVGRMSRGGSRLEEALEAMKGLKKGQAPAKDVERLVQELGKLQKQMEALQRAIASLPSPPPASQQEQSRQGYALPLLEAQTAADALKQALKGGDYGLAARIASELSGHLSRIEEGIRQAAAQEASSSVSDQTSRRMRRTEALWSEVIEEQRRLLEASQGVEEDRLRRFVEEQKKLLAELARRQAVLVSSAAAASFPGDVLGQMKAVQAELESGKIVQAPALLKSTIERLRGASSVGGLLAREEQSILERLEGAARQEALADASDERPRRLSGRQEALRLRTGNLQEELRGVEDQGGFLPAGAREKVEEARQEQAAAAQALGEGDMKEAQRRQQNALRLLEEGGAELGQAQRRQQSIESGMGRPFQGPAGASGPARPGGGADTGFVPLPAGREDAPGRELRLELERSQRESRPEAYDSIIKEYFKRIAE